MFFLSQVKDTDVEFQEIFNIFYWIYWKYFGQLDFTDVLVSLERAQQDGIPGDESNQKLLLIPSPSLFTNTWSHYFIFKYNKGYFSIFKYFIFCYHFIHYDYKGIQDKLSVCCRDESKIFN